MTRQFVGNISQVSNQVNSVVMGLAGAERIFELMDQEPEQDEGYVTLVNATEKDGQLVECKERTGTWAWKHPHKADGTVTYTRLAGDVRLFDVDFEYVPGKPVLHDISLYAKPGQKVAFVGATGAGKTTITNLLNRFYDIADGKIRYDGINIGKIRKSDLRRALGIVLQDTVLFTGTVMENIRYGNLEATDEECIAAAQLAGADDFITRLPEGYQTMLTENGANLSQGQRQLLSIARAAVADPPVMILDEATSSIDTRTEAIVQQGMDALMYGRTVFVIAHRLSTVKNANVIIVLDHGRSSSGHPRGAHRPEGPVLPALHRRFRAGVRQQRNTMKMAGTLSRPGHQLFPFQFLCRQEQKQRSSHKNRPPIQAPASIASSQTCKKNPEVSPVTRRTPPWPSAGSTGRWPGRRPAPRRPPRGRETGAGPHPPGARAPAPPRPASAPPPP